MTAESVQCAVVATAVLYVKFWITTAIQGKKRFEGGGRPPEDQKFGLQDGDVEQNFEATTQEATRWNRIVANDLENLPLGLLLVWSCALAQGVSPNANGNDAFSSWHIAFTSAFVAGRIGHTVCFAYSLQPYRTISYTVALIALLSLAVLSVVAVFP